MIFFDQSRTLLLPAGVQVNALLAQLADLSNNSTSCLRNISMFKLNVAYFSSLTYVEAVDLGNAMERHPTIYTCWQF